MTGHQKPLFSSQPSYNEAECLSSRFLYCLHTTNSCECIYDACVAFRVDS